MPNVSVESRAITEAQRLCAHAEKEINGTITLLKRESSSVFAEWKDQKAKEFEEILQQCIVSLQQPLQDLQRCDTYLVRLSQALDEYEAIHFTGGGRGNDHSEPASPASPSASFSLDACNQALARDGRNMQMVDISGIEVDGLSEDSFWSHNGISEGEWQACMSQYESMMQSYAGGMSIDQCYDEYPQTAAAIFGRDPIRLSECNGSLAISGGRHRVAMAQRLGITHLPAIVY